MKIFRIATWACVFLMAGLLAFLTLDNAFNGPLAERRANGSSTPLQGALPQIGGSFEAVRTDGTTITQQDILGRPHAMFFGFTHCPDVCPTTLYEASQWLDALGPAAEEIDVYFVSVDPARDTPEVLKDYITSFGDEITGITGTEAQIAEMAKKYRIFYERIDDEDGDYTVNHSASTLLFAPDGTLFGTIAYGEQSETAVAKMRRLAEAGET